MRLGHDKNIIHTVKLPTTDYIWLLGDSQVIEKWAIREILELTERFQPQIIAVNSRFRGISINSAYYNDHNKVLNEFGWHLTLTGATIYSKTAIATLYKLDAADCTNFPQIALIFGHLSKACSFYWVNSDCIYANSNRTSYWISNMFQVFIDDWSRAIRNLPDCYDVVIKEKVITEHSRKAKIFRLKSILTARSIGAYNVYLFKKYQAELSLHSGLRPSVLLIIALLPRNVLGILIAIEKHLIYLRLKQDVLS